MLVFIALKSWQIEAKIYYPSFWPNDEILKSFGFFQVSDQTKHTASTVGMQTSVETSDLLHQRLQGVPKRIERIKKAILRKDFHSFAEITMKVLPVYAVQTWKNNLTFISFPAIAANICWGLLWSFSIVISQGMLDHWKCLSIKQDTYELKINTLMAAWFSWVYITQATILCPEQVMKCYRYCKFLIKRKELIFAQNCRKHLLGILKFRHYFLRAEYY